MQNVVLRERIVFGLDEQLVAVAAALGETLAETDLVHAGFEFQLALGGENAVAQQLDASTRSVQAFDLAGNLESLGAVHLRGTMRSLTKTSLRAPARLTGSVHTCVRCERRSGIRRALLPRFSLPSDTSSNRPWRLSPIWASAGLKRRLYVGRFAVEPRGKIRRRIATRRGFPLRQRART